MKINYRGDIYVKLDTHPFTEPEMLNAITGIKEKGMNFIRGRDFMANRSLWPTIKWAKEQGLLDLTYTDDMKPTGWKITWKL